jgi:hypothetical protein
VLRERQLSKIRIEISSVEASVGGEEEKKRKLGTLFGAIESRKMELCIQDYSIAQTSLEQIFNQFAAQVTFFIQSIFFGGELKMILYPLARGGDRSCGWDSAFVTSFWENFGFFR